MNSAAGKWARGRAGVHALVLVVLAACALPVMGQLASTQLLRLEIDSTSLAAALKRFGQQSGIEVTLPESTLIERPTSPLQGWYTAEDALQILLDGSGLEFRIVAPQKVVVEVTRSRIFRFASVRIDGVRRGSTAADTSETFAVQGVSLGGKGSADPKDIPQTVSVISAKQIEEQRLTDLADVMQQAPGISVISSGSGEAAFYSRGFAISAMQVDGGAPLYALSGSLNYSTRGDLRAIYDHVEILRGADGLFSGFGDPSGVINLVRKRPLDHFQVISDLSVGSWQNYRSSLDVTGPLSSDAKVRGRVVGSVQSEHYFYDNAKSSGTTLFGIVEIDAATGTLLTLGTSIARLRSKPFVGGLPADSSGGLLAVSRKTSFVPPWAKNDNLNSEVFASAEHTFSSGWVTKASITRTQQRSDQQYASILGPIESSTGEGGLANYFGDTSSNVQLALDLNARGKVQFLGVDHDLLVGYSSSTADAKGWTFYSFSNNDAPVNLYTYDPDSAAVPNVSGVDATYPTIRSSQKTAYGRITSHVTTNASLLLGASWNSYYLGVDRQDNQPNPFSTFEARGKKAAFSYFAGKYDVTSSVTAYGAYTLIYQDQSQAGLLSGGTAPPITGRSVEFGAKFERQDKKLLGSLSFYDIRKKNQATYLSDPTPGQSPYCCYAIGNQVDRSRGLDVEISGEVDRGLEVTGGLTRNLNASEGSDAGSQQGQSFFTRGPANLLRVWTSYQLATPGFRRWTFGAGINAQSRISTNLGGELIRQGGYAVVAARVSYQYDANFSVSLNVDNLFDRTYYQTILWNRGGNFYGTPRSLTLGVQGKF